VASLRGTVVSAGIDYLTVTYRPETLTTGLQSILDELLKSEYQSGSKLKPWGMAGYSGWCCGGVQTGTRADGWIVRLSGDVARFNWWDFYEVSDSCTRMDCQVTVKFDCDPSTIVSRHEREVRRFHSVHRPKWKVRWIGNSDGSRTLYLGSRQSEKFMRIYDKQRESGQECFQGCVRYEVQFNGHGARQCARHMGHEVNSAVGCCGEVSAFLQDHACSQWFTANPMSHVCASAHSRNYERTLQWLSNQVRPSVERMIAIGKADEVYRALGLDYRELNAVSREYQDKEFVN